MGVPSAYLRCVLPYRYYVKLYVNGHYVDGSDVASLGDNFVGDLKDVFRYKKRGKLGSCSVACASTPAEQTAAPRFHKMHHTELMT